MEKEVVTLEKASELYGKTFQELKDMIENGELYFKIENGKVVLPIKQFQGVPTKEK